MKLCKVMDMDSVVGQGGSGFGSGFGSGYGFHSGVTGGVRDDGRSLGAGCGSATNDHLVPDRVLGINLTPACTNHDREYSTCGVTQQQADRQFASDVYSTCREQGGNVLTCGTLAATYSGAVAFGGGSAYSSAQGAAGCTNSSTTDSSSADATNGSDSMSDSYGGAGPGGW